MIARERSEYSIFANTEDGLKLRNHIKDMFKEHESIDIEVCGIAGDYCVVETLKNIVKWFKDTNRIKVYLDGVASIDGGTTIKNYMSVNSINTYNA